jgi:hypothetical protein
MRRGGLGEVLEDIYTSLFTLHFIAFIGAAGGGLCDMLLLRMYTTLGTLNPRHLPCRARSQQPIKRSQTAYLSFSRHPSSADVKPQCLVPLQRTLLSCHSLISLIDMWSFSLPVALTLLNWPWPFPGIPNPGPGLPGKYVRYEDLNTCPKLSPRPLPTSARGVWVPYHKTPLLACIDCA